MKSVWVPGLEKEMNCSVAFSFRLPDDYSQLELKVAAANTFRVFVNDKFVFYGPVRTAHGYAVASNVPLSEHLSSSNNYLTIEVASYHIDTFYTLDEDPFFAAEIYVGEKLVANTDDFKAYILSDRLKKVQRFSTQRPFIEVYTSYPRAALYSGNSPYAEAELIEVEGRKLIETEHPNYDFGKQIHGSEIEVGNVTYSENIGPLSDRIFTNDPPIKKSYPFDELDCQASSEVLKMDYVVTGEKSNGTISQNQYVFKVNDKYFYLSGQI
jgi:alpha-L-rhamnosidase